MNESPLVEYRIEATFLVSKYSRWYGFGKVTNIPCHAGGYYARVTRTITLKHNRVRGLMNQFDVAAWLAKSYADAAVVGPYVLERIKLWIDGEYIGEISESDRRKRNFEVVKGGKRSC